MRPAAPGSHPGVRAESRRELHAAPAHREDPWGEPGRVHMDGHLQVQDSRLVQGGLGRVHMDGQLQVQDTRLVQ